MLYLAKAQVPKIISSINFQTLIITIKARVITWIPRMAQKIEHLEVWSIRLLLDRSQEYLWVARVNSIYQIMLTILTRTVAAHNLLNYLRKSARSPLTIRKGSLLMFIILTNLVLLISIPHQKRPCNSSKIWIKTIGSVARIICRNRRLKELVVAVWLILLSNQIPRIKIKGMSSWLRTN